MLKHKCVAMSLNCNIFPIVKVIRDNNLVEEESILFKELYVTYKGRYPKLSPKELRNTVTDAYVRFKSVDFKRMFGDWMLLKKIQTDTAANDDLALFSGVYNNDLELLQNSIVMPLNEQGEPDLRSFETLMTRDSATIFLKDVSKYPFLNDSEQAYINRVLSAVVIRIMPTIENQTYKDFKSGDKVRNVVASVLREYANRSDKGKGIKSYMELLQEVQDECKAKGYTNKQILDNTEFRNYYDKAQNLINLADDIAHLDNQHIWSSFIQYFRVVFYGDINDFDMEDDMTMADLNNAVVTFKDNEITKTWNSFRQFKTNYKEIISNRFRRFLTTMIYNNEANLMNPFFKDAPSDGAGSYYNKYGLVMPFDIDMIWNDLVQCASNISTRNELVNNLTMLSEDVYSGQLQPLIDEFALEGEDDPDKDKKDIFYNMLIKSIDLAMPLVTNSTTKRYNITKKGYDLTYKVIAKNRDSFVRNFVYDKYRRILTDILQHSNRRDIEVTINPNPRSILDNIANVLILSNKLRLDWTPNTLIYYVSSKLNVPINIIKNAISLDKNNSDITNTEEILIDDINDILLKIKNNILNLQKTFNNILDSMYTTKLKAYQGIRASSLLGGEFFITESGKLVSGKEVLNISSPVDDLKGYIYKLAAVGSYNIRNQIDLTYINVHGEQEYTPEFHNFITSMMQGLTNLAGDVNTDIVLLRFKEYYNSPSMKYNPLIWNFDGNGFFNRDIDEKGNYRTDEKGNWILSTHRAVNESAVKAFMVSRFGGIFDEDSNGGLDYTEMHDYMWTQDVVMRQLQNRYSLPSADASRIYEFTVPGKLNSPKSTDNEVLSIQFFTDGVVSNAATLKAGNIENNKLYKAVKNTLYSELESMRMARDLLFDYDVNTRTLKLKDKYLRNREDVKAEFDNLSIDDKSVYYKDAISEEAAFEKYYQSYNIDNNVFDGLPQPIFWDGKQMFKDGKPTGAIFRLGNLNFRYYDSKGKATVRDITDYINLALAYNDDLTVKEVNEKTFGSKPEAYMICGMEHYLDANGNEINMKEIMDKAFILFFRDRLANQLIDAYDTFDGIRDRIQSTLTYKDILSQVYYYKSNDIAKPYKNIPLKNDEYKNNQHWAYVISNMMLEHYVDDVAIQDIFTGFTYEFKNASDWAKRCNLNARIGAKSRTESTYRQIVVQDVWLKDNMLDLIAPFKEYGDNREADVIWSRFSDIVESTDGFNIITEEECIRRFKETGDYYDFELPGGNTLEQLIAGNQTMGGSDYAKIVQQLKYYYFNRTTPKINNSMAEDFILSHQDKNSTLVIFRNMYRGTMYETLAGWMSQEGIDSINFISAHKVGGMPAVNLFTVSPDNKTAVLNINVDENTGKYVLDGYPDGVEDYVHVLNHGNLFTQQTVPSHLVDEENKLGTQLQKRILDNIDFNGEYTISGIVRKGKNGNFDFNEAGVFEHYQMLLSSNTSDAQYKLLGDWGALNPDGTIKFKKEEDGRDSDLIEVNMDLLLNDLRQYFCRNEIDRNILKAIVVVNGKPFIPFNHPTIKQRIESVLLAHITKCITNLKIKGAHVTIQPDTFLRPANRISYGKDKMIVGDNGNVKRLIDEGHITFSDDYWKERAELNEDGSIKRDETGHPIIKKDADFSLKSEYIDAVGVFHPAEIILNKWDSRLKVDENGLLDLNTIPENLRTMFGIRIPTPIEGHQSMFVCKVVGVLNNNTSQAVVPFHLMIRTGWGFAIDSIYLYIKDFNVINNSYVEYGMDDSKLSKRQDIEHLIHTYFALEYKNIEDKHINKKLFILDRIAKAKEAIARKKGLVTDPNLIALKSKLSSLIALRFNSKNIGKRNALSKEIDKIQLEINQYEEEHPDPLDTKEALPKLYGIKNKAYSDLKLDESNYKKARYRFIKFRVLPLYNKLNRYDRANTKAKNNAIIDVLIGIHSDPKNLLNKEQPTELQECVDAANYVNAIAGFTSGTMNQHFLIDQIKIRNINNSIAALKGVSIYRDNALSVFGVTQTKLIKELAIPFKLEYSNIKGYENAANKIIFAHDRISSVFNTERINSDQLNIEYNDYEGYAIIHARSIYNNDKGTWLDINGQTIAQQRHQLTSHMLDAVKQNMGHNTNIYTIGNMSLLSSFPISWNVNLDYNGVQVNGVNRFIYPALIESQQIIVDLVKDASIKQIERITDFANVSFNNIRGAYLIKAIYSLAKAYDENNSFRELAKDYVTEDKFNTCLINILNEIYKALKRKKTIDIRYADRSFTKIKSNQIYYAAQFLSALSNSLADRIYDINSEPEYNAKTITELDKALKLGQQYKHNLPSDLEYGMYLIEQLEILDYYEYCDKAVNSMKRAQGVLVIEQRGAGLRIADSNKQIESIAELEYNLRKLKDDCKRKGIDADLINDLEYNYYKLIDIPSRGELIKNRIEQFNDIIKNRNPKATKKDFIEMPQCPFTIGDKSLISAIFPSITDKDWKITDSAYPLLQQQLISINMLSTQLFSDLFISERSDFKSKVNYLLSKLGRCNDPAIKDAIIQYALLHNIRNLGFFNTNDSGDNDPYGTVDELSVRKRLIGTMELERTKNIYGNSKPKYTGNINLALLTEDLTTWNYQMIPTIEGHNNKVKMFKRLPVAMQLAMVKNTLARNKKYKCILDNPNHILNLIVINNNIESVFKYNYLRLGTKTSTDIDYTRTTFAQLINSTDDYLRILGENLIRYAFWINELKFGKTISNYIPADMYGQYTLLDGTKVSAFKIEYDKDITDIDFTSIDGTYDEIIRDYKLATTGQSKQFRMDGKALYRYAAALSNVTNNILLRDEQSLDEFLEAFVRSHVGDLDIVRKMRLEYSYVDGEIRIRENTPTYTLMNKSVLSKAILNKRDFDESESSDKFDDELDVGIQNSIESSLKDILFVKHNDIWEVVNQIIIEPIEFVNNGANAIDLYLIRDEKFIEGEIEGVGSKACVYLQKGILYKRIDLNDCAVYYPISKTLPSEYMDTCIDAFKYGIEAPFVYINIAKVLTSFIRGSNK